MSVDSDLQRRVDPLLTATGEGEDGAVFSPFFGDGAARAGVVYPRDGQGPETIQRRHGELFFYMHQQMLARYDTEGVIAGLERVEPHPLRGPGAPDYCGALENYPDRRRLGYPFDPPFADGIADTFAAAPSMTSVPVTIRCESARPRE